MICFFEYSMYHLRILTTEECAQFFSKQIDSVYDFVTLPFQAIRDLCIPMLSGKYVLGHMCRPRAKYGSHCKLFWSVLISQPLYG